MDSVTYKPKQKRSEQNLKNIINAIMRLVEDKYFEQITIMEIVSEANLSAGAFYRRFKSKEDALPVIYAQFQDELRTWLEQKSKQWESMGLAELIVDMTKSIFDFVLAKKGIFRTIYLNARLHSEVLLPEMLEQRVSDFKYLASFYERFANKQDPDTLKKIRFAIFTLVNNAIEKCVYPEITPASGCSHNIEESIEATTLMLQAYLSAELQNNV